MSSISKHKADNKAWLALIIEGIKKIADPGKGFVDYEFFEFYKTYSNFLHYLVAHLYGECNWEDFLELCSHELLISDFALSKLQELGKALKEFREKTKNLKDFDLLRQDEWDTVVPLAKTCLEELSLLKKKG